MRLAPEKAEAAIRQKIAEPLGLSVEAAAAGMYRVINANMAHGVREITVKRGVDPREFPMVVAGGAGALHACMIAHELEMPTLLFPQTASVLCAAGMLQSDLQHDFVRSYVCRADTLDLGKLRALVEEMATEGYAQLKREGIEQGQTRHTVSLDLRYLKQYHEVTVPVPNEAIQNGDLETIARAFHRDHNALYGYDLVAENTVLELINVRVGCIGQTEKPALETAAEGEADASAALKGRRRAFVPDAGEGTFEEIPVYDGHALKPGHRLEGPALIERRDTTLLLTGSYRCAVDRHGSCLITRREAS